jgi:hypothetical protein
VLEIGAGEPFVGDLLSRLGHEVWIVDPYDGTGNGPIEFEKYQRECPKLNFVKARFNDTLIGPPVGGLDAIYSISVLEHVPGELLAGVFAGHHRFLKPDGWSVHAVDHVLRGNGQKEHLQNLRRMASHLAPASTNLDDVLAASERDIETYFLSAESHNRWRGSVPYDQFPMRVCVSVHMCSRRRDLPALQSRR